MKISSKKFNPNATQKGQTLSTTNRYATSSTKKNPFDITEDEMAKVREMGLNEES